mmetsp:Transcript_6822/g.20296  ORF Transcript_6822/g.20296 Transcript_6822/m.20296 type:complete len:421 (+) Transcript_6822:1195-2457(+)
MLLLIARLCILTGMSRKPCFDRSPTKQKTYLLLILLPNLEHLLVGKTNAVHPLKAVVVGISQPVGRRVPRGRKGLNLAGMNEMRPPAQIDEISALVHRGTGALGDLGPYDLLLERVARDEPQCLVLGDDHPLEFLLLLGDLGHLGHDGLVVIFSERVLRAHVTIVVEPPGEGRADGQSAPVQVLQRLPEHVSARVPKGGLGVRIGIELEQFQLGDRSDERAGQIPQLRFFERVFGRLDLLLHSLAILVFAHESVVDVRASDPVLGRIVIRNDIRVGHPRHDGRIGQTLTDRARHVVRSRPPRLERSGRAPLLGVFGQHRPVGHGHRYGHGNLGAEFGVPSRLDLSVRVLPRLDPFGIGRAPFEGRSANELGGRVVHAGSVGDQGPTALGASCLLGCGGLVAAGRGRGGGGGRGGGRDGLI